MRQLLPLDELNVLSSQIQGAESLERDVLVDNILDFLIYSYTLGNGVVNESFNLAQDVDVDQLKESIYKRIKGENFVDRIDEHLANDDREGIIRVIDTEMHRNYNQAIYDTAKDTGVSFKKRWATMRDDKVRETHDYLEGVEVDLDSEFVTFDGDSAKFPGDFSRAENNVNCRCVIDLVRVEAPPQLSLNWSDPFQI